MVLLSELDELALAHIVAKPKPLLAHARADLDTLHLVSQGSYWFQDDGLGVAKLLLERGADMNAQDKDDATPLHLACYRRWLDIARVLLDFDGKAQAENLND